MKNEAQCVAKMLIKHEQVLYLRRRQAPSTSFFMKYKPENALNDLWNFLVV